MVLWEQLVTASTMMPGSCKQHSVARHGTAQQAVSRHAHVLHCGLAMPRTGTLPAVLHTHVIRGVFDLLPESSCCVLQGLLRRVTSPHAVVLQGACTADDTQLLGACDKSHHSKGRCPYPMPAPLSCAPAHSLCCCTIYNL